MTKKKNNDDMNSLNAYEKKQIKEIQAWKAEEPGVISEAFGVVIEPVAWLVEKIVPQSAITGALDFSSSAAEWLTDTDDIRRDGEVKIIDELKIKDLELSDELADEVHNWAIGMAVVEGAGAGVFGIFGAPVDVPAIIVLALRTIHKIGVCYGYECQTKKDKDFVKAVLSASGANSVSEKAAALALLKSIEVQIAKTTWKKIAELAATRQVSKEGAIIAIRNLAKQLGINITKRKALSAIPAIGALIGGSVNGWYVKEVGWAARRAYQERWLLDNHKIIEI